MHGILVYLGFSLPKTFCSVSKYLHGLFPHFLQVFTQISPYHYIQNSNDSPSTPYASYYASYFHSAYQQVIYHLLPHCLYPTT